MSDSPPPLDGTLGACIIGAVLGTFLYGLETMQTYSYYTRYPNDPLRLKVLVAGIWFTELGHAIALWHALYQMTVTFYGQIAHILDPPHSLEMTVLFSAIINITVQSFFALRIRTLSGYWYIPILCSILTVARFVFNMIMIIVFWQSSGFEVLQEKIEWAMIGVSTIGPAVDIITAATLCFYLYRLRKSRSHFKQTRRMVDSLILWSVETTTITSAAGILQLILFLARKDLAWMTFFLMQPKLFANSILAHLNGRERLRVGGTPTLDSGSRGGGSRGGVSGVSRDPNRSVVIRMHHVTELHDGVVPGTPIDNLKSNHDHELHQF